MAALYYDEVKNHAGKMRLGEGDNEVFSRVYVRGRAPRLTGFSQKREENSQKIAEVRKALAGRSA